ncbi:MAG: hypothetical protein LBQ45_00220 [Mycoplasmataceae bacterium]|jgi:2-keto-3-deoxy-6-phosphogluconate aldolase|nr:hypothetical protein [Mycoplasmataceae bacterium]
MLANPKTPLFKENVIKSMVQQQLVLTPGVEKKAKHSISYKDGVVSIEFIPQSYILNIYEVCSRIQTLINAFLYKTYKKDIIINVVAKI